MTVASWTALATVSGVLVAYAVNADGYPVHKAELNDGGIWITNQSMGAVGRQNVPVAQIDGRVFDGTPFTASPELDVLQDGSAVISVDKAGHTLMPIDVSMATGLEDQKVSVGGTAVFGGGSLGVVAPDTGKLWATEVDPETGVASLADLVSSSKPLATVGGGTVGAAGLDGTVYAASTDSGETVTLRRAAGGPGFEKPATGEIGVKPAGALTGMTVVGDVPVMIDEKGNLLASSANLGNVGAGAALQQSGPQADEVLVATPESLVAVAVQGGKKREVADVGAQGGVAAPVTLPNGCAFAAWGSGETGTLVSACGEAKAETKNFAIEDGAELVFRVNRNQVVLNDQRSGMAWTVTGAEPQEISNWEAFQPQTEKKDDSDSHKTEAETTQPPQATDDELGARTGRTTVLNVLDNDLIASEGILSIVGIKGVNREDVQIQIAPDRQSLLATVAPGARGATGTAKFRYTIDDGTAKKTSQDDGEVTLNLRADGASGKPEPRKNAKVREYFVAAGGVIELAVTPEWRDYDYGDPIVVESVKTSGDAEVSTTALGLIRFEAPVGSKGGLQTVSYSVTTGGAAVNGTVKVHVIPAGTRTEAAQPEPDVVSGEVGGVITVRPLDNDIPGADGSDSGAKLTIAGRVAPVGGLDVETDLESGKVIIKGSKPGTYLLNYRAGFGAANRADGQIRVDISPATPEGEKPVATPDVTAVHGVSPVTVDVLANDFDPRGRMLVVQNAKPSGEDSQLEVAVIDGRWVRVNATDGEMTPKSQSVEYTISNGSATATGSINVTQRDALSGAANAPIAQMDRISVRAGDTAAAPVLDNDATPSGDPVGLVLDPSIEPIGELRVLPAVGTAYVAGRQVRFVAPEKVDGPVDVDVQYVVENTGDPTAETSIGTLKVHITPPPSKTNPNLAPTPRALEGRTVQGDLLTLKLPAVGSDPDGDSVAVTGVATAPKLGRILAFGANSLTYQAYPDAQGTDEFTYTVTDPYGATATGQVRVGVVQAGAPQAPLAINDTYFADPDRTVDVDAVANDLRTPGTQVRILPLEGAPEGVKLQSSTGPISVDAPDHGASRRTTYTISNGLDESRGVVTIKGRDGYNNPPITSDLYATPEAGATTVEVDVLAGVHDVDGPENDLKLDAVTGVETSAEGVGAKIKGGKVIVPITGVAQVLAYRVLDGDGAAAAAAIYVPAKPTGAPYLKPDAEIHMDPGSTKEVDLTDLVEDPEGDAVVLTTVDALSASPLDRLAVKGSDKDTLAVTATKSEGPGSIVFEVSDRAKLSDPEAHTAYISVPVHVGEKKPVINCPTQPVDVPEGGVSKTIDIASVCHVWTADPREAQKLDFSADWKQAINGVDVSTDGGGVQLVADGDARRGDVGTLAIGADGFEATGELLVRVVALPAPKLAPIKLDTEAGKPVSVDVDQYLNSPLPPSSRETKVLSATAAGGASAATTLEGSKITFTPKPDTDGVMRYRIEVSDVGGSATSGRPTAVGDVVLAVVARPDAPTNLVAGQEMLSNTVALTWRTPDNNGLRIDGYEVAYSGPTNGTFRCAGSPCRVTNLKNGEPYTFKVRAHNATQQNGGWSEYSNTTQATPDAFTGPVGNLRVVLQRDNAVQIAWDAPAPCDCSDVQKYRVSYAGGGVQDVAPGTRTFTARPGVNGENVTISVVPLNKKGIQENSGPVTTVTGMGAGKPAAPSAPNLSPTNRPGNATKAITVSWGAVGANGPGPASYQVQRSGGGSGTTVVCAWTTATSCADEVTNDGTVYTYQVQAKNAEADSERERVAGGSAQHISDWSGGSQIEASAPPDPIVIQSLTPTGADGTARIVFDVGASHGKTNTVTCTSSAGGCGSWTFANGGASGQTRTITGLPDGSSSTVTLRACNGGTANLCVSDQAQVVTYGPIGAVSINATPDAPAAGDRSTNWSINIDPNGKAVTYVVLRNGTQIANGTTGTGSFSRSGSENLPSYSTTYTYTVRVSDTAGSSRAGKQDSDTARTGSEPNPSVWATKGDSCSGSSCTGATIPCGATATCYFIVSNANNFVGGVSCRVYNEGGSPFETGAWTQRDGSHRTTVWVGPNIRWYIGCANGANSPVYEWDN
ncbi:Ig-like domain-containing protein [Nocardioides cavernaquae]|uniref:Fibronectin type III domain-containing protein n=1 Tax=Nocardioides cavernaquae TaxID=2321396 RepID=A0A3A5H7J3_9ACTN|nr:Ig-like domain-containing protein [Nocardioides cavernaquae]RJS45375.1 fibronectin type III domain-containing protein [Nocardioides cavernaquae]